LFRSTFRSSLTLVVALAAGTAAAQSRDAASPADSSARPSASASAPAEQPAAAPATSPLTIHIGDAELLIGGFMDATAVTRSTNLGSGIVTSFGTIPFSNTPQGHLSEIRFSAQHSRLTLQATSKIGRANVKGYLEADFLGNTAQNLNVTSNSDSAYACTGCSSRRASSSFSPARRGAC
jgi:hypothetical protein